MGFHAWLVTKDLRTELGRESLTHDFFFLLSFNKYLFKKCYVQNIVLDAPADTVEITTGTSFNTGSLFSSGEKAIPGSFCRDGNDPIQDCSHMWLPSTFNVIGVFEELNFSCYLILINLN